MVRLMISDVVVMIALLMMIRLMMVAAVMLTAVTAEIMLVVSEITILPISKADSH